MNKMVLVVAGAGIVCAGGAALILTQMTSAPPPAVVVQQTEAPPAPVKPRTVSVLVAARPLVVGTTIAPEDLEWQEWPEGSVRRDQGIVMAVIETERGDIMRQFSEVVLRVPMVRGEPMVDDKVIRPGGGSLLALVLAPGMRSVTIPVDAIGSGGGLVQPGDRIDLLLTSDLGDENAGRIDPLTGRARPRLFTETVMQDIKVISADRRLAPSAAPETPPPGTLTLEVTPEQAERIITAGRMGRFGAVVRPLRRGADPEREGPIITTDIQITPRLNALRRGVDPESIDPSENPFARPAAPPPAQVAAPVAAPAPPPPPPPTQQILMYRFNVPTTHTVVDGRIAQTPGGGGDTALPMAPMGSPPPLPFNTGIPPMSAPSAVPGAGDAGAPPPPSAPSSQGSPAGAGGAPAAPGAPGTNPSNGGASAAPGTVAPVAHPSLAPPPSILPMR